MLVVSGADLLAHADALHLNERDRPRIDPDGRNVIRFGITLPKTADHRVVLHAKFLGNKHPEELTLTIPKDLYGKIVKQMYYDVNEEEKTH